MGDQSKTEVSIRLVSADGKLTPESASPEESLRLGSLFFRIIEKAAGNQVSLEMSGISIQPGSLRISTETPNGNVAVAASEQFSEWSKSGAPPGVRVDIEQFKKRLEKQRLLCFSEVGGHSVEIFGDRQEVTGALAVISIRSTVARLDFSNRKATFDSPHEDRFTLSVSDEHFATLLEDDPRGYEYEVTAEVEYNPAGSITRGRLLELERVKEVEDLKQALKDMFREACSRWSSAEEFDRSVRDG